MIYQSLLLVTSGANRWKSRRQEHEAAEGLRLQPGSRDAMLAIARFLLFKKLCATWVFIFLLSACGSQGWNQAVGFGRVHHCLLGLISPLCLPGPGPEPVGGRHNFCLPIALRIL